MTVNEMIKKFRLELAEQNGQLKGYYVALGRESAAFFSWVFENDLVIVQINGDLPETKARKYEAALNSI